MMHPVGGGGPGGVEINATVIIRFIIALLCCDS